MAPFFKKSFLFASLRRRHSHKFESTPSPNAPAPSSPPMLNSYSLPNLEELRGISVSFLEELSPLLQSRPVENLGSPVLSAHVSIFSPGQSSKAQIVSPCIDVTIGPDSGTAITALGPVTSLEKKVPTSPAQSSCSSLSTVRAAKIMRRRAANIWTVEKSSEESNAVQEINEAFDQVGAMLCERENVDNSDEKIKLPDDCAYHERLISDMSDKLYGLKNAYWDLQAEEQTLSNENHALTLQNERLNKELTSNADFQLLQKLDDQITKLKRTIDHIINTEMDVPVLRAANYSLQRGADASNALFLALRIAASNAPDDDPWKTIMGSQQVGYSHQEHVATTKRNAELRSEIHLMDKKYRLWKIKAQMNAKYAGYNTPSNSAISLLLHSLERAPKKWPEDVNNILDKFEEGYEIKMRALVKPAVAPGPSGSQRSPHVEVNVTASPILTTAIASEADSRDGVMPPQPPEVVLSPAISVKLAEVILPSALPLESAEVVLSPVLSPESASNDSASTTSKVPANVVISPALSAIASVEEPTHVIRRYIPGLELFGGDGLGSVPPDLFDSPTDSEEHEITSQRESRCHLESLESSPGLEYIDEYPAHDYRNAVPLDQCHAESSPGLEYINEYPAHDRLDIVPREQHSAGSSPGLEYIDEYPVHDHRGAMPLEQYSAESSPDPEHINVHPADDRQNLVLLEGDDNSSDIVPSTNVMDRGSFVQAPSHNTPSPSAEGADPEIDSLTNYEEINADGRRNPILRDDSSSEDSLMAVPSSKLGRVEKEKDKSILSTIARSASSSISNLKRISSTSSSIKRSLSSGLNRLRQMALKPRKKDNPASTGSHRRRVSSVQAKENKIPPAKKSNSSSINAPAPSKRFYRPTISSGLKTVNDTQPVKSTPNRLPKAVRGNIEPLRRVPLTDVTVRPKPVARSPRSTRQKVLNQGRKAVRSLARLVS